MSNARDKANIPALNFSSTGIDDNATSTAITISSGGVVSIGTTSTSGGWQVKVAGSNAPLELARTAGDTSERSHLGFTREGTFVGQLKSDATNLWLEASAGDLIINTGGGSERMRIDSSGNVGIGESSPDAKLDVRSQINVTNANGVSLQSLTGTRYGYSTAYRTILLGSTGTGTSKNIAIGYDPSSNASGNFAGNGTEILFPNTVSFITPNSTDDNYIRPVIQLKDGTVGIGESTPLGKFHIRDGDSATTSVDSLADELVVESSGSGGMTILTPASSTGNIFFGDPNNNSAGRVQYSHSSNAMLFATNNSERMRIDSSGNVGIGESSPLGKLHVKSADTGAGSVSGNANELVIENTGEVGITIQSDNSGTGNLYFGDIANGSVGRVSYSHADDSMRFNVNGSQVLYLKNDGKIGTGSSSGTLELEGGATYPGARIALSGGLASTDPGTFKFFTDDGTDTNPAERMRIDSNGRVYIGTTSQISGTHNHKLGVSQTGSETPISTETDSTVSRFAIDFHNPNGRVGYILTNGSSTSYNTSSDHRLKENVSYDFDATTRLKQLKPARFNFIADANTTVDGFLAHEVQNIVPEAISGEKDAVDEDGNPEYQGIDQSKLVPLLVKTIQELEARITTLEANNP
jgi:hypothetical protein